MTNREAKWLVGFIAERSCKTEADKEAMELAIESLEKQIPSKPISYKQTNKFGLWEYDCCPVCGTEVREEYDNFCNNCGKALKWSEEE